MLLRKEDLTLSPSLNQLFPRIILWLKLEIRRIGVGGGHNNRILIIEP